MRDIPVISLRDVSLSFGEKNILDTATLNLNRFNKVALVGHNGCGKSTLLKIMEGSISPDSGEIYIEPGLKISYIEQDPIFNNLELTGKSYIEQQLGDPSLFYKAQPHIDSLKASVDILIKNMSGGERRRIALICGLIQEPDVLLMDEPTNHLDLEAIKWLEEELIIFKGACLIISHDKMFLKNITNRILWLEEGHIHFSNKGFKYFYDWQESILKNKEQKEVRLQKKLEKEKEWLLKGVTARRKRNQGRLKKLNQLRQDRASILRQDNNISWEIPPEKLGAKVIIEALNISKSFNEKVIIKNFSSRILKNDRIGIIGANGSGKTTLLKLLIGHLAPDNGSVKLGKNINVTYLDQHRESLNSKKTLKQILCENGGDYILYGKKKKHVVSYLKDFLFSPQQINSKISSLSGGELNRLLLAKSLCVPSSILILDEPTNDLDMDTLDKLQEMLDNYEGTVLIVSHDRDFLDKTVTSIISVEQDGTLIEYAGGYSDYLLSQKLKETGKNKKDLSKNKTLKKTKKQERPKSERLTYKQIYRLKKIPVEISNLDKLIKKCEEKLFDVELYQKDPQAFNIITNDLEAYKKKKNKIEEEWLELEIIKEKLEKEK